MKSLFFSVFILTSTFISAQKSAYTGLLFSTGEGNQAFLQLEEDIDIAVVRLEYLTDFDVDNRLYLKMQFRVCKTGNFRFFVAMPPFQYSFKEKGYNTPFNFEAAWKNKLLINTDIYKDGVNFSVRLRHKF